MAIASVLREKLAKMRQQAEERNAQRKAEKLGYPYVDLKGKPISVDALALIKEKDARAAYAAVIEAKSGKAVLLVLDPALSQTQKVIEDLKNNNYQIVVYLASLNSLRMAWDFYKFTSEELEEITAKIEIEESRLIELKNTLVSLESVRESLKNLQETRNIRTSEILEVILAGAMANRASDIHLEQEENFVKLRLRIDGALHDVFDRIKENVYLYLLSRIKLLSGMKLNVHNEPQDGRFSVGLSDKEIEMRVAISPTEFGEVTVMRLLDPDLVNLSLADLGLRDDDLGIVMEELRKPNGMILNSGPTGSGKTTTLYAFLKHKKTPELKIITIEDPVEYHLEGIEQTRVDEDAGYTFANGLRSIMRQDPDIILVGEIRDEETAQIAIQSALTGHLVFSTVHANAAAGVVPRLVDLGARVFSVGPALNLVIAQRLVRRLCLDCKKQKTVDDGLRKKIEKFLDNLPPRVNKENFKNIAIFEPQGCEKCNQFGYRGRIAVYELLSVGSEMEELITAAASEVKIQEFAERRGMVTMQQDGILKIINGITSVEEVESVTGPLEWG